MKTLSIRDLNRNTASVLDAVDGGEVFEVRRRGKTVGYLTRTVPPPERKPDWKAHFDWLRKQPKAPGKALLKQFEEDRRRMREKEDSLIKPR